MKSIDQKKELSYAQIFEIYRDKVIHFSVLDENRKGVVCGYETYHLILAVLAGKRGWKQLDTNDRIVTHQYNLLGYWYISEEDMILSEYYRNKRNFEN